MTSSLTTNPLVDRAVSDVGAAERVQHKHRKAIVFDLPRPDAAVRGSSEVQDDRALLASDRGVAHGLHPLVRLLSDPRFETSAATTRRDRDVANAFEGLRPGPRDDSEREDSLAAELRKSVAALAPDGEVRPLPVAGLRPDTVLADLHRSASPIAAPNETEPRLTALVQVVYDDVSRPVAMSQAEMGSSDTSKPVPEWASSVMEGERPLRPTPEAPAALSSQDVPQTTQVAPAASGVDGQTQSLPPEFPIGTETKAGAHRNGIADQPGKSLMPDKSYISPLNEKRAISAASPPSASMDAGEPGQHSLPLYDALRARWTRRGRATRPGKPGSGRAWSILAIFGWRRRPIVTREDDEIEDEPPQRSAHSG